MDITAEEAKSKLQEGYAALKVAFLKFKKIDEETYPELKDLSFEDYLRGTLDLDQVIECIAE